jgi:hypothetical protein
MRPLLGLALALCLLPAAPRPARAQSAAADSGRFIVFQGDTPVAREHYVLQWRGDSLALSAASDRQLQDEQGNRVPYRKVMLLVADARDLALRRYVSNQDFAGSKLVRGLVPGDTSITFYEERDGAGDAYRLVQPPGRLYVMESPFFSLFEIVCRSLSEKTFTSRPVQLLALSDSMTTPIATVTRLAPDTLGLGEHRVVTRHYRFEDPSAVFDLWADSQGRLIRLVHAESGLHVEREPDTTPARKPKRAASGTRR